jgi:hypothetical protein
MRSQTTNYSEIWESLETTASERTGHERTKVVRDMGAAGIRGFLGLGLPERRRQLLIQIPSATVVNPNDFPHWHGLDVGLFEGDVANIKSGRFFVLGERERQPTAVYAALVEDLWSHVADLTGWDEVAGELQQRLTRWGDFFSEIGPRGLSLPAQRGLFGELWFIASHLVPATGVGHALQAWIGQRQAHQDFHFAEAAIEVKTSIAKQLIEIRIANERQLDDRGLPALYLAILLLTELETGGESLPDQVRGLRELAAATGGLAVFEGKLLEAGYLDEQAHLYSRGYVLRSFHAFKVTEGFPRLLEEDLPTGVGDVSYSIDLAVAKPFEVPTVKPYWWSVDHC